MFARRPSLLGAALPALALASLLGACAPVPSPHASAPASPAAAKPAATPAPKAAAAAEDPLVAWPDDATDPVSSGPPAAPPLPPEPDVEATLVDRPGAGAEPLGRPRDFAWDGKEVVARAITPPATTKPSARVSGGGRSRALGGDPMAARGSMWGDGLGEAYGAGGLGLSGTGAGGGGKADSGGLGGVGTVGHGAGWGRLSGEHKAGPSTRSGSGVSMGGAAAADPRPAGQDESGVKAGEWDDNANFLDFRRYLAREAESTRARRVDMATRRFLVVRDADGKPVPNCEVRVEAAGRTVRMLTSSTGRALVFPHAEGVVAPTVSATATCADAGTARATFTVDAVDGAVDLHVPGKRKLEDRPTVDIAFVLDTTGSMSEEIDAVKRTVQRVAERLSSRKMTVRFSLVEYKDRGDEFVVRVHPMTRDVAGFIGGMRKVTASGGGDMPEDVIEGLRAGLTRVDWSKSSAVRLAFLIGDAPPQLDYDRGSYVDAMRAANRAGIVLHTIAASGMDDLGQVVWRQVAQYTGGTNLFVLRGGAGPQSAGAGDAKSSCGTTHTDYSSGNLDALITAKVERAVAALEADPMRIAGLGQDESTKPCAQRVASQ